MCNGFNPELSIWSIPVQKQGLYAYIVLTMTSTGTLSVYLLSYCWIQIETYM